MPTEINPAGPVDIALVEDDPDFARYIELLLNTRLGATVRHYKDGLDGLVGILESRPVLALLDLDLPGLRGEEICRRLRTSPRCRDLPVVICSSMPEPQKRELELLRIGADAYLEKPFVDEQFLTTVGYQLERGRQLAAAAPAQAPPPASAAPAPAAPVKPAPAMAWPDSSMSKTDEDSTPGRGLRDAEFAGYRIESILGGGGMGTVYKAFQPKLGRRVALKVLLKSLAGIPLAVERFMREGRIMAALDHPNIVRVFDSGRTPYSYYIAMEVVDGPSLDTRIDDGPPFSWSEQLSIARQCLDAVEYLHGQGVLHRDLKPSNVLLAGGLAVKLGDFGISRASVGDLAQEYRLTRDASLVGTPSFMAPEQLQGAEADESTDVYALGRTLGCLFEGKRPSIPPKPLHLTRPDLPRGLSDTLAACCHADATQRLPNIAGVRARMEAAVLGFAGN